MILFKGKADSGSSVVVEKFEKEGNLYVSITQNYGNGWMVNVCTERLTDRRYDQQFIDRKVKDGERCIDIWNDAGREMREKLESIRSQ